MDQQTPAAIAKFVLESFAPHVFAGVPSTQKSLASALNKYPRLYDMFSELQTTIEYKVAQLMDILHKDKLEKKWPVQQNNGYYHQGHQADSYKAMQDDIEKLRKAVDQRDRTIAGLNARIAEIENKFDSVD